MKKIIIVGAGNIGSRHLQALKAVNFPLKIYVVDPNPDSLNIAKERYDSIPFGQHNHEIQFIKKMKKFDEKIDLAIIATTSDIRRKVIEELLKYNTVMYLILEKILFQKSEDYNFIKNLFESHNCQAWVNCVRRMIPVYQDQFKDWFNKKQIFFSVSGSNWGLMSNIIHLVDYMVYLTECDDFLIDPSYLDPLLTPTKRKGFLELMGILQVHFKDGSHGIFTCYPSGELPATVNIVSDKINCFIDQDEGKAWVCDATKGSGWKIIDAKILYTSHLTTIIAEDILKKNKCSLTPYSESMKLHLATFNPILEFLNKNSRQKYSYYPFT